LPAPPASQQIARRALRIALWVLVAALGLARFLWLAADFPNYSPWMIDQAKFTDEGWWANAAIMHALTGHWHIAGGYNPAAALPVWPAILGALFNFTGIGIIAARALSVVFSLATLAVAYLLIRRCAPSRIAAEAAVLLLAASPFAFVFSRLAILDTVAVFEFCLALLLASRTAKDRILPPIALALLITAALLTKTTFAVLIPAIAWMAFHSAGRGWRALLRVLLVTAVVPFALFRLWGLFAAWLGYGADYNFFYGVNAMPDIDWPQTLHWLHDLAVNGLWIDRLLYPAALAILVASVALARSLSTPRMKTYPWGPRLWRNPLFTASWIAIAGAALFVFSRQDDYAPRYFLVMLAPVIFIVVLAFDHALVAATRESAGGTRTPRIVAGVLAALILGAAGANTVTIAGFLAHREYQLYGAARDIAARVRADRTRNQLLFGVSAAEIGLIAGLPSINGAYDTDDMAAMAAKVARYKPGWYLAWNDENETDALRGYTLVPVSSYRIFDDDERTTLVLYKVQGTVNSEQGTGVKPVRKSTK